MRVKPKKKSSELFFRASMERGSFGFYLVIALTAMAPSLFWGRAYFEDDLLAFSLPASDFLKACFSQGHWPLWCPLLFGGQPFAADPDCMVFYPPSYFYLLPSKAFGTGLFYALHLFLAFLGTHLWLKSAGFSEKAGRVGAVIYGLSGFFWWEIIHPPVLAGYAWLPWWGFALERLAQTGKRHWAFAAGLFFALLFLTGHFQILLGAVYGGTIYFLFRFFYIFRPRKFEMGIDGGDVPALAAAGLWGALPLLALAVPFFEFSTYSGRTHQALDYLSFNAPFSDNPRELFRFLFPSQLGALNQTSFSTRDILENSGYLGIWWPFLLVLAFQLAPRWKAGVWFWSGCGLLSLGLCLGPSTPVHRWFCEYVLGFAFIRAPYRFIYLYIIAGVFLAALGWTYWEGKKQKELRAYLPWIAAYGILTAGLAVFYFPPQGPALWGLVFGGLGLGFMAKTGRIARAGEWIFVGALALSMIGNGWKAAPSHLGPDSNFDFLKNRPELAQVKQMTGLGRVFIGDGIPYSARSGETILSLALPTNVVYAVGIRHVKGYDPLSLWRTSQLFGLPIQTLSRLMAANVIATGKKKPFSPPGYVEEPLGPFYIFRALKPFPFVYAPKRFEVVRSDEDRLALMGQKGFDPYQLSYFSTAPPAERPLKTFSHPDSMSFQLTRDDPDEEVFQVNRGQGGWTVFSEVVYPGWKAWVDGVSAPLLTANHVFRSVFVPAGSHEVRFSYEPFWWTPIRIALALWLLSVFGLFWKPWRQWTLGMES